MTRKIDAVILLLQVYFVVMNVTVERLYCRSELREGFLVRETLAFCAKYNPLFLARPPWMVMATCVSSYAFAPGYVLIAYAAVFQRWRRDATWILLFLGAKLNALIFYHIMEFTSDTPPRHLVPYFAVEGPYLLSIALVLTRVGWGERNARQQEKQL